MAEPVVDLSGVRFAWGGGPIVIDVAAFALSPGERVFLKGPSGSGKSTFLGLIAGVLKADAGRVSVLGQDLSTLSAARRDRLRADHLGVVFQLFNLLPYLSVTANTTLPCRFSQRRQAKAGPDPDAEARRLLARLGLDDPALLSRRAVDLSVGQQQRVAVARALIGAPDLVVADEPTSALDADARDRFIALLLEEAERSGAALLFVSHDAALGARFDRVLDLGEINAAGRAGKAAA